MWKAQTGTFIHLWPEMGGPTEMAQGRTREQVVSIIEMAHVEVPFGMFSGGRGFGNGFEGIVICSWGQ